ncbi:hypothetical protein J4474_02630 [Candidatus Pacearchaeota archaeon]|nr:hypothetical protein [Candidatus Pacearchaeota archaeon]
MLDTETIRKIEDFVYPQPRSIQEIAQFIGKNWRTADRYVDEITKQFGTLSTKNFREGTRGALKVVYWASVEKVSNSIFQEQMEKDILTGKTKHDFSGFNIFQHVKDKEKTAWVKQGKNEVDLGRLSDFTEFLNKAEKQVLFFSGNLSFVNYKDKKNDVFKVLENLVKRGISIKIICRVDIGGRNNVEKLLSLNHKYGKELIEIRHREQPLRITVVDKKIANIKEVKEPTGRENELNEKTFIFYTIKDREWIEWLSKIFWKMFNNSVSSEKRTAEMDKIFNKNL